MRLTPQMLLILFAVGAAGCSTAPVIEEPVVASLSVNAGPGRFQQLEFPLRLPPDGKDKTIFTGSFAKLQPSTKWAPMLSICLQGEDPVRDQVCLRLSVSKNGRSVIPNRLEHLGAQDPNPYRQEFSAIELSKQPFRILLEQEAGTAKFSLNGVPLFESKHVSRPTRFALFCSSAVCAVSLADGGT